MFENRVLRKILGQKGGEERGGWRKLQQEQLHDSNTVRTRR
jgi:hypothetical protein